MGTTTGRGPIRSARFFGLPTTRLGSWAIRLSGLFLVLFTAWFAYVTATPIPRPTFFSDPLHAVLILGAAASAVLGMVIGILALFAARERSVLNFAGIAIGIIVLLWTIAELSGH